MPRTIIGICGYKGSGKDTVGEYLEREMGFTRYGFADPMKEACKLIFLWTDQNMQGEEKERIDPVWGISPRQALQHMGTEWGQYGLSSAFPDFKEITGRTLWVKRFKILAESNLIPRWVITDVRFPHEVEMLRDMGAKILKVTRSSLEMNDLHESEAHVKAIRPDMEIMNDFDIPILYSAVQTVVRMWL